MGGIVQMFSLLHFIFQFAFRVTYSTPFLPVFLIPGRFHKMEQKQTTSSPSAPLSLTLSDEFAFNKLLREC